MENPFYIPGDLTGTKVAPLEEVPQEAVLSAEEPEEVQPAATEPTAEPAAEAPAEEPQEEFTAEDLL